MKIKLKNEKCMPYKKHYSDAGWDLKANDTYKIFPGWDAKIHTGVRVEIPLNYMGLLVPRSSMGLKGLVLKNTIGIIDSDYRGEIIAHIKNVNKNSILYIDKYTRFAQLIVVPILLETLEIVEDLSETDRGNGGFGHTGEH